MTSWSRPSSLLVGLTLLGSAAAAEPLPRTFTLVEATLTSVQDITGQPGAPVACVDEHGRRCDDGSYRVAFTIDRVLAGPEVGGIVRREQSSAQPLAGLSYLLVLSPSYDGPQIRWSGFSRFGLCMGEADARRLGLADQLAQYPCVNP